MKFIEGNVTDPHTGLAATMWLPYSLSHESRGSVAEIEVGGQTRLALDGLIMLTKAFTEQQRDRNNLGQDCRAFAYAWQKGWDMGGVDFANVSFGLPSLSFLSQDGDPAGLRVASPGNMVLLEEARPHEQQFLQGTSHLLVRATVDNDEPLYLSKLGLSGPVALSTIEQSMAFYPTNTIAIVHEIVSSLDLDM